MTGNNPNLDLVNIIMRIHNLVKFYHQVLKRNSERNSRAITLLQM